MSKCGKGIWKGNTANFSLFEPHYFYHAEAQSRTRER
jgi:hypothetical protein